MLRTCPIDHRCMTGIAVDDVIAPVLACARPCARLEGDADEAGGVPRSRWHGHRGARLSRTPRPDRGVPLVGRGDPPAQRGGLCSRHRHQPGGHRARALRRRRSCRQRTRASMRCCESRGAVVDGYYYCPHHPDGIVDRYRSGAAAGSRRRGWCSRRRPIWISTCADRSWSATSGSTSASRATPARRGVLVRTGYAGGEEPMPPPGCEPAVIVDTLLDAARWILAAPAASR